jgi:hypothetical protein
MDGTGAGALPRLLCVHLQHDVDPRHLSLGRASTSKGLALGHCRYSLRQVPPPECRDVSAADFTRGGKIPAGGGWRTLGRAAGKRNTWAGKSSGKQSKYRNPCTATTTCIPPLMGTPGRPTASRWPMSAKTPQQRLGMPTPGSLSA